MMSARPPDGIISVERMRKVVVLPLPLGPSKPEDLCRANVERNASQRDAIAVLMAQVLKLNDG